MQWQYGFMGAYDGYTGRIEVDDHTITILRQGMAAKLSGQRVPSRTLPLAAVSDVAFKDASRLVNGHLQIAFGGEPLPALTATTAASDPNTVLFRHKQREAFRELAAFLQKVVAMNRSQGVDSAQVYAAADDPQAHHVGKLDAYAQRLEEKSATLQAQSEERQAAGRQDRGEKLAAKLDPSGERPDIVAAAARMSNRLGGGRELKKLAEHLHDGEEVQLIAQGTYADRQGILVLTNLRLLFLFHGLVSQAKEDFPLRLISSVQTKSGMVTGELRVFVSGNNAVIKGIVKNDLAPLADAVREGIAAASTPPPAPAATAAAPEPPDVFAQIEKLADLHRAGILSDEEFAEKKRELLGRL